MKNNRLILTIAVIALTLIFATACGSSSFGVRIDEDLNGEITAENASEDSEGAAGTLTIKTGQKIVIESALEDDGVISVKLVPFGAGEDATAEELEEAADADNAVFEQEISGSGTQEFDVPAGDYLLSAEVEKKATGTIKISVK